MSERKRSSGSHNRLNKARQAMAAFCDHEFLTRHSLFANLYASEPLKIDLSDDQQVRTYLGVDSLADNDLHEYIYFSRRDKKMLLYGLLKAYLQYGAKYQILVIENCEKVDRMELKEYLNSNGAGPFRTADPFRTASQKETNLSQQLDKRVIWQYSDSPTLLKFNLQFIPLLMQQHPFLKCVVLSDINTFETHEKGTLDKLYRKIPRELAVISLRKDFYDYRFMQKPEQALQRTESGIELHERVTHTLCRKYELFNTHVSYLVPVEYVKSPCLTIEETYSIALIRKDESDRFLEVTFQAYPFRLQGSRYLD